MGGPWLFVLLSVLDAQEDYTGGKPQEEAHEEAQEQEQEQEQEHYAKQPCYSTSCKSGRMDAASSHAISQDVSLL